MHVTSLSRRFDDLTAPPDQRTRYIAHPRMDTRSYCKSPNIIIRINKYTHINDHTNYERQPTSIPRT